MPRISEFYGVVIAMYYREHGVPHFHATYAGETVVVAIETGEVLAGTGVAAGPFEWSRSGPESIAGTCEAMGPRPRGRSPGTHRSTAVA
jgi:hypothetical protein